MRRTQKRFSEILIIALSVFICFTVSCGVKSPYYQKQMSIPDARWAYAFQPEFKINIEDTAAHYDMMLLVRHDEGYPYANLWLRMHIKAPGDTTFSEGKRIELELADVEGKWKGSGMGSIWEHRILLNRSQQPTFKEPGTYEIRIEQVMRNNPLSSILNIGLRIEKRRL